jgi:hypothetical protein
MSATEVVSRMPKVTLYVKDVDAPIWERARQLAGDSLSSIVGRALAAYVTAEENRATAQTALERKAQSIVIDVEPEEGPSRKVRLTGVLAAEGIKTNRYMIDAYVTTSGKIVLLENAQGISGLRAESVRVFEDYDEFLQAEPTEELGAAIAEALGEEWIEEID